MTDASRLRVVGGAAMLACVAAALAFYGARDRAPPASPVVASGPAAPRPAPQGPASDPAAQGPAPAQQAPAQQTTAQTRPVVAQPGPPGTEASRAASPRSDPPRFDVVRMGARGMVVVAGRAAPGAEVVLLEGGREIGRARADARGEWVILPDDPLGAGARELSLRARLPGGDDVAGPDTVLVVGPAPAEAQVAQARTPNDVTPGGATPGQAAGIAPRAEPVPPAPRDAMAAPPPERRAEAPSPPPARAEPARRAEPSPPARAEPPPAPARAEEAAGAAPVPRPAGEAGGAGRTAGGAPDHPGPSLVLLLPPTAAAAPPRALSAPSGGAQAAILGLDVVDYDDSNTMRFAGTAPPGARLRIYADDRHLGDAAADPSGRWSLTPAEAPPVGRHTLRVDQLAADGAAPAPVAGRIEVAFQRESLPPGAIRDGRVVVQPGNNLWRIARDAYGRGIRYTVIYRANQAQIRNPDRIYPGQVFAVPEAN